MGVALVVRGLLNGACARVLELHADPPGGYKCTTVVRRLPHPLRVNKDRYTRSMSPQKDNKPRVTQRSVMVLRGARYASDALAYIVIAVKLASASR